jgi:hypothetical protein
VEFNNEWAFGYPEEKHKELKRNNRTACTSEKSNSKKCEKKLDKKNGILYFCSC